MKECLEQIMMPGKVCLAFWRTNSTFQHCLHQSRLVRPLECKLTLVQSFIPPATLLPLSAARCTLTQAKQAMTGSTQSAIQATLSLICAVAWSPLVSRLSTALGLAWFYNLHGHVQYPMQGTGRIPGIVEGLAIPDRARLPSSFSQNRCIR